MPTQSVLNGSSIGRIGYFEIGYTTPGGSNLKTCITAHGFEDARKTFEKERLGCFRNIREISDTEYSKLREEALATQEGRAGA